MQSNVPQPSTGPRGDGIRPVFKVAMAVSLVLVTLVLVIFSAVKIAGKKPAVPDAVPDAAVVAEPSPPAPAAELKPWIRRSRPPAPSPGDPGPTDVRTAATADQRAAAMASNLWAAAEPPGRSNK